MMTRFLRFPSRGLSLIEVVLGAAVLFVVSVSVYQAYNALIRVFTNLRVESFATELAIEEMEIIRNLPYRDIGTESGVPSGFVSPSKEKSKGGILFSIIATIRNIDDPFDGLSGGDPGDDAPADYKLIELSITCVNCVDAKTYTFTGRAAPQEETSNSGGILLIKAINASGLPVSGASVQVTNSAVSPAVSISDVTDILGVLKIVGVPPASESYRVVVTKTGYSTDQTYASSAQNPNPAKPHLTVAEQLTTQATFAIDRVSTIIITGISENCALIGNLVFDLSGAKLIGLDPVIPKYYQTFNTLADSVVAVSALEWDTYTVFFDQSPNQDAIKGIIPLSPLSLPPNATRDLKVVAKQPADPNGLLVTVIDSVSLLPLSDASVTLTSTTTSYSSALMTGRGSLTHTAWTLIENENPNIAFVVESDGNIETNNPYGELKLKESVPGTFAARGWLIAQFDTGSPSVFHSISWLPINQPPDTGLDSVKIQIASSSSPPAPGALYRGPDGTRNTFYTTAVTNINPLHSGDRYLNYKIYLGTASTTFTPNVSDVSLVYASDCVAPGQAFFSGLSSGSYELTATRSGYENAADIANVNSAWQAKTILISPSPP